MKIEKLYPEYKNYIWGGERLATDYGKACDVRPEVSEPCLRSVFLQTINCMLSGQAGRRQNIPFVGQYAALYLLK
jgi:hypothetical protein